MATRLTTHFTLEELTVTQQRGLDNTPTGQPLSNLLETARWLEGVRILLGAPIIVTSGYRSPAVNAAVGGTKNSQHMSGEAVDFICPGFGSPRQVIERIKGSNLPYDQLILEYDRWVHGSWKPVGFRRQVLVIDGNGTRSFA